MDEHPEGARYRAALQSMRPLDSSVIASWNEGQQQAASAIEASVMDAIKVDEENIADDFNKMKGPNEAKAKPAKLCLP